VHAGGLDSRRVLRALGWTGVGIGLLAVTVPRPALRLLGLEGDGRGVLLTAGLYGSRDLALGLSLLRVAGDQPIDPRWLDMLLISQIGDLALAAGLSRTGRFSRRALVATLAGAGATTAAALYARVSVGRA
jgi:hypothetical protein